jgi:NTP pyrophosphatase (non-canonical NTP hydrolase)
MKMVPQKRAKAWGCPLMIVSNSFIMKEVGELFTTVRKKTKTLQENL